MKKEYCSLFRNLPIACSGWHEIGLNANARHFSYFSYFSYFVMRRLVKLKHCFAVTDSRCNFKPCSYFIVLFTKSFVDLKEQVKYSIAFFTHHDYHLCFNDLNFGLIVQNFQFSSVNL
jgi:hypothetical protein